MFCLGDTFCVRAGGVDMVVVCDPKEFPAIVRSPDLSMLKAVRYLGMAVPLGMFSCHYHFGGV